MLKQQPAQGKRQVAINTLCKGFIKFVDRFLISIFWKSRAECQPLLYPHDLLNRRKRMAVGAAFPAQNIGVAAVMLAVFYEALRDEIYFANIGGNVGQPPVVKVILF